MGRNAQKRRARKLRQRPGDGGAEDGTGRTPSIDDVEDEQAVRWLEKTIFRSRAELPLPERHDFFGAILRASFALMVDEDLDAVAAEVGRMMRADRVVVCWGDDLAVRGRFRAAARDSAVPLETMLTDVARRRIIEDGEAVIIEDVPRDDSLQAPVGARQEFGALIAVPLHDGPARRGILCAARREVCSFHADDGALLVELATVLSRDWRRSRLLKEALTCDVTGLLSRPGALFLLERDLERADREQRYCAVAMLDVDGLSGLNQELGRDKTDVVLRQLADALTEQSRGSEWIAHLGGGTFCTVLGGADKVDVEGALHRLAQTAQEVAAQTGVTLSLSAGAAVRGQQESAADSLRASIRALLRAKAESGGHLVIAEAGGSEPGQ